MAKELKTKSFTTADDFNKALNQLPMSSGDMILPSVFREDGKELKLIATGEMQTRPTRAAREGREEKFYAVAVCELENGDRFSVLRSKYTPQGSIIEGTVKLIPEGTMQNGKATTRDLWSFEVTKVTENSAPRPAAPTITP